MHAYVAAFTRQIHQGFSSTIARIGHEHFRRVDRLAGHTAVRKHGRDESSREALAKTRYRITRPQRQLPQEHCALAKGVGLLKKPLHFPIDALTRASRTDQRIGYRVVLLAQFLKNR